MKMKLGFLAIFLSFAFLPTFAINATNPTNNQTQTASSQDATSIGWVIFVDKAEVDMANQALKRKNLSNDVKDYAEFLKKEHAENLKDALKLSMQIKEKPVLPQETKEMKEKAKAANKEMSKMDDKQFQIHFINDMVAGHEQALNKLNDLIKTANNADVKKFLENTRTHVEKHLEIAKKIQADLKS